MTFGTHIPGVQLRPGHLQVALDLAQLTSGETYLELGSGEGLGLVAAAERGAVARGIEYLPDVAERSIEHARSEGHDVAVVTGDVLQGDFSGVDVILTHLGPAFHDILTGYFERSISPGTRIVACGWPIANWMHTATTDGTNNPAWLYEPTTPNGQGRLEIDSIVTAAPTAVARTANVAAERPVMMGCSLTAGVALHDVKLEAHLSPTVDDDHGEAACAIIGASCAVIAPGQRLAATVVLDADVAAGRELQLTASGTTPWGTDDMQISTASQLDAG